MQNKSEWVLRVRSGLDDAILGQILLLRRKVGHHKYAMKVCSVVILAELRIGVPDLLGEYFFSNIC